MVIFLKANVASLTASFLDYVVTICLVSFFHVEVVKASMIGTICGGILNFFIGRNWVFVSKRRKVHQQALRYAWVWVGNLMLNTGGMFILTRISSAHYVIWKIIVSLLVGFFYNYMLQKKYVFKHH